MTRTEHLLCIVAEECNEIAQRVSKAMRFGLTEVEPGQVKTNAQRIMGEVNDFVAAYQMLAAGDPFMCDSVEMQSAIDAKKAKIEKFLTYSAECGTVTGG